MIIALRPCPGLHVTFVFRAPLRSSLFVFPQARCRAMDRICLATRFCDNDTDPVAKVNDKVISAPMLNRWLRKILLVHLV